PGARARGRWLPSLLRETREGLGVVRRMRGIRVVIVGSAAALFFGGLFNVGELLFATEELGTSGAGYSALVAVFGLGFIVGSLTGSKGGSPYLLRKRFLQGIVVMGLGFVLSGLAPSFAVALLTFTLAGFGNGVMLVHERVIVQEIVPDGVLGRAFGVKDALASWAFGSAFFAAGGLLSAIDSRQLIVGAGVGGLVIAAGCAIALRREGLPEGARRERSRLGGGGRAVGDLRAHEEGADMIGPGDLR
ncbi:MAG: MFS transporter, partial [Pseudonocardiaceae bacterium]